MQHSMWFYIIVTAGAFLVLYGIVGFRRWWYGLVGFISALLLTFAQQLVEMGVWATVLAALLFVGLSLAVLRDQRQFSRGVR